MSSFWAKIDCEFQPKQIRNFCIIRMKFPLFSYWDVSHSSPGRNTAIELTCDCQAKHTDLIRLTQTAEATLALTKLKNALLDNFSQRSRYKAIASLPACWGWVARVTCTFYNMLYEDRLDNEDNPILSVTILQQYPCVVFSGIYQCTNRLPPPRLSFSS